MPVVCEFTKSFETNESSFSQVYFKNLSFWHFTYFRRNAVVLAGQFFFFFFNTPLQLIISNILTANKITLGMDMCGFIK